VTITPFYHPLKLPNFVDDLETLLLLLVRTATTLLMEVVLDGDDDDFTNGTLLLVGSIGGFCVCCWDVGFGGGRYRPTCGTTNDASSSNNNGVLIFFVVAVVVAIPVLETYNDYE
jgi:hypothetical protein